MSALPSEVELFRGERERMLLRRSERGSFSVFMASVVLVVFVGTIMVVLLPVTAAVLLVDRAVRWGRGLIWPRSLVDAVRLQRHRRQWVWLFRGICRRCLNVCRHRI